MTVDSYARRKYREFKHLHWGAVHGAANRDRDLPYEFPDFETFIKHSLTGEELQEAIIRRRLHKCLNTGMKGHRIYEDRTLTCPRCGINRLFKIDVEYDYLFGRPHLATYRPTLL